MRKVWIRRALLGVAAVVAAVAWTVPPSAAGPIPTGRLGVGDSIMLSARGELGTYHLAVNAKVGRQFSEGLRIVSALEANGSLPKRVLVHLGTNGWIDPADCDELVAVAGPSRRVFLVTIRVPRDWMRPNNLVLQSCAVDHERVHLIRWAMVSGPHPAWFADDGYHLNTLGQREYAAYVDARMDAILASVLSGH